MSIYTLIDGTSWGEAHRRVTASYNQNKFEKVSHLSDQ